MRTSLSFLVTALSLMVGVCACVSVNMARLDEVDRAPKPPDALIEILNSNTVTRPYLTIATLRVSDGGHDISDQRLLDRCKEEARGLGGDAILDLEVSSELGGRRQEDGETQFVGQVVVWK